MTGEPTTLPFHPARADCQAAAAASAEGWLLNSLKASFVMVELTLRLTRSPSLVLLAVYEEVLFTEVGWMPGSNSQEKPDRSVFFCFFFLARYQLLCCFLCFWDFLFYS